MLLSQFNSELSEDVVLVVEVLSHDVCVHHLLVHHVLVVLRYERDQKVEQNDQKNDLWSPPVDVDHSGDDIIKRCVVLSAAQEADSWSTDVANSIFESLEEVSKN